MFSVAQKRVIAGIVQRILRATNHPELPEGEIQFHLHVDGAEGWSWADIKNNGAVPRPDVNPWNEIQAQKSQPPPASDETEPWLKSVDEIRNQCMFSFGDTGDILRSKLEQAVRRAIRRGIEIGRSQVLAEENVEKAIANLDARQSDGEWHINERDRLILRDFVEQLRKA